MNKSAFNALCANLDFLTLEQLFTIRDMCNQLIDETIDDEPDDIDSDVGFNPYTGCFDEDC